jgi:hypothetical protein
MGQQHCFQFWYPEITLVLILEWKKFVKKRHTALNKERKKSKQNKKEWSHNQGLFRLQDDKLVERQLLLLRCVPVNQSNGFKLCPLFKGQPTYEEYDCVVIYFEVPKCS